MYFPLFIDLSEKEVLVVGAGVIASRRVRTLCGFAGHIIVVAPEISEEIQALAAQYPITVLRGEVACHPAVDNSFLNADQQEKKSAFSGMVQREESVRFLDEDQKGKKGSFWNAGREEKKDSLLDIDQRDGELSASGDGKEEVFRFGPELFDGKALVLAATDDRALNRQIACACRERGIPVNVSSEKEECDFYFPSVIQKDGVVIGINASGRDHALVKRTRIELEEFLKK